MKNILVLTGSPRKDGNTTLLANAFIEGANCMFDDDFTKLIPVLEKANVRHNLTVNDFQWVIEMYNQSNSLTDFANKLRRMFIQEMQDCIDSGKDFYGVTVTKEI